MDPEPALPDWAAERLAEFERHLAAERGLSPHTVRAYLGDVTALLEHACQDGLDDLGGLGITVIRAWLADQHASGMARASLARRAAAARAFTAYGHTRGWLASDPGPLLGTPKAARHLPDVLRQEQMEAVFAAAQAGPGPAGDPHAAALAWRDTAIMELLYATGIRVSELCGLDLGDLDTGGGPSGSSARAARSESSGRHARRPGGRSAGVHAGPPVLVSERSGPGSVPGRPGRAARSADGAPGRARPDRGGRVGARHRAARPAPHRGHAPARGRRGPAQRAGDPRPRVARDDPDLHPRRRSSGCWRPTVRRTRGRNGQFGRAAAR